MTLQSSPGWVVERQGLATASRMRDILDYLKNGKESAARRQYKVDLVTERAMGRAMTHYVTPAMQRGLDEEPNARAAYEATTGSLCGPARLVLHPRIEFFAGTPDAFVGADGLAEFKVPQASTFVTWTLGGCIPEEHVPQLLAQLSVTGRQWVDFCAYSPESGKTFIRRLVRDEEAIANTEAAALAFLAEVDALFDQYTAAAA
jgi:hypothetical protein